MNELGQLLLIEDNPDDYESTLRSFRKANLSNPVKWCKDGKDALDFLFRRGPYEGDAAATTPPSLILLDLNMPGFDGRRLLEAVKSDPTLRRVPVVVLTTSNDQKDINRCYDLGASSYIQKPVGFDGLLEAAQRLKSYWFGLVIMPKFEKAA